MTQRITAVASVLTLLSSAAAGQAAYSLQGDFSIAFNPNDVWSYGYRPTVASADFTLYTTTGQFVGSSGVVDIHKSPGSPFLSVGKNLGTVAYNGGEGTLIPTGEVSVHPEVGNATVARFTAPAAGLYVVSVAASRFGGPADGSSRFSLVRQGTSIYAETVSQPYTYQTTRVTHVELPVGGVLDFVVDVGDGVSFHDSTGLRATLSPALPGDANLDGRVNADDLALIDRGAARQLGGWSNGDFNVDGAVNAADYLIIDTATVQSEPIALAALIADREVQFGPAYTASLLSAVPEPAAGLLVTAGLVSLAFRPHARRRENRVL